MISDVASHPSDPRVIAEKRVGQTLANKWRIDRLVDVGGMAAVYAATHRNGKRVAIKMLHPFIAAHADVRERFLREGYVANQVEHAGAVSILDDDTTADGAPFLVMELLDGESVDQWIGRSGGRLPLPDVLAIADQVLDVLSAFHAVGVVHRDIKPGNIYVTKAGIVKVLDFGLARLRDPRFTGAPTASGIVLGTAAYMPPEQAQGKVDQVGPLVDVFAVGAVMFRALAGRPVHDAKGATERLFQAMKDRAPSLGIVQPDMSPWIVGLVDKALAFNKADRWQSAAEMRAEVRRTYRSLRTEAERIRPNPASTSVPDLDHSQDVSNAFEALLEPSILVDVSFSSESTVDKPNKLG